MVVSMSRDPTIASIKGFDICQQLSVLEAAQFWIELSVRLAARADSILIAVLLTYDRMLKEA